MQELLFLRFTRRLILIDIHIKFREEILNRVNTFFMTDKVPREIIQ